MIAGAGPAHAVQFGTYEAVKEFTGANDDSSEYQWASTGAFPSISCFGEDKVEVWLGMRA